MMTVEKWSGDEGDAAEKMADVFAYRERMRKLAGKPAVIQVLREKGGPGKESALVSILVPLLPPTTFHNR